MVFVSSPNTLCVVFSVIKFFILNFIHSSVPVSLVMYLYINSMSNLYTEINRFFDG